MPRIIPAGIRTKLDTVQGTKPVILAKIVWDERDTAWYSTEAYETGTLSSTTITADPRIISISPIDTTIKVSQSGTASNVTIVLDDTDGVLKPYIDDNSFIGKIMYLYLTYQSIDRDPANFALLFTGDIVSPVLWDEGSRQVTITLLGHLNSSVAGMTTEQTYLRYPDEESRNKLWPIVFGTARRYEPVLVTSIPSTTNYSPISRVTLRELNYLYKLCYEFCSAEYWMVKKEQPHENEYLNHSYQQVYIAEYQKAKKKFQDYANQLSNFAQSAKQDFQAFVTFLVTRLRYVVLCERYSADLLYIDQELARIKGEQDQIDAGASGNPPVTPIRVAYKTRLETKRTEIKEAYDGAAQQVGYTGTAPYPYGDSAYWNLATQILGMNLHELVVDDISDWGYNVNDEIQVRINGLILNVKITSWTTLQVLAIRPTYQNIEIITQEGVPDYETILVDPETPDLNGLFLLIHDEEAPVENYFLTKVAAHDLSTGELTIESPCYISETGYVNANNFSRVVFDDTYKIIGAAPIILDEWFRYTNLTLNDVLAAASNQYEDRTIGIPEIYDSDWTAKPGDKVELYIPNFKYVYVLNHAPSVEVKEVMGYLEDQLASVPSQYYYGYLDYEWDGEHFTLLIMDRLLSSRGEGWSDKILVTVESTLDSNPANVIKHIANTYTTLTVNTGSYGSTNFTHLATKLTKYPMNFAVTDAMDAMQLMERIAWECRTSIWVTNNVLHCRYVPEQVSEAATITEDDIDVDTLKLINYDTENLVTEVTAIWKKTYDKAVKASFKNNVRYYGTRKKEFTFLAYNDPKMVTKTCGFWLMRYSNSWKKISFRSSLNLLHLLPYDIVKMDLQNDLITTDPAVYGLVETAVADLTNMTIDFTVWLPIRTGETSEYPLSYPGTSGSVTYPTIYDPYAGRGNKIILSTGGELDFGFIYATQPKDVGPTAPADTDDVTPSINYGNVVPYIWQPPKLADKNPRPNITEDNFRITLDTRIYDPRTNLCGKLSDIFTILQPANDESLGLSEYISFNVLHRDASHGPSTAITTVGSDIGTNETIVNVSRDKRGHDVLISNDGEYSTIVPQKMDVLAIKNNFLVAEDSWNPYGGAHITQARTLRFNMHTFIMDRYAPFQANITNAQLLHSALNGIWGVWLYEYVEMVEQINPGDDRRRRGYALNCFEPMYEYDDDGYIPGTSFVPQPANTGPEYTPYGVTMFPVKRRSAINFGGINYFLDSVSCIFYARNSFTGTCDPPGA